MPLLLNVASGNEVGTWFTILSVLQWVSLFDFGLASGARNKIAKLRAKNKSHDISRVISETITTLGVVTTFVCVLLTIFCYIAPLHNIFSDIKVDLVRNVLVFSLIGVGMNFIFSFSNQVFAAYEKPVYFSASGALTNSLYLVFLVLSKLIGFGGIYTLCICYLLSLTISNCSIIFMLFYQHKETRPNINFCRINFHCFMGFGLQIFIIQLAALILFTTSKLIISWKLGSESVVIYEAAYKIVAIAILFHTIVMNSYWSTFTIAYEKKEWLWIKNTLKKLLYFMIPICIFSIFYFISASKIIEIWMGNDYVAEKSVYMGFSIFIVLSCWSNVFAYFVNGMGKVKPQMVSAILAASVNIPLSIFFIEKMNLGVAGAVYATCVSLLLFSVIGPIQVIKIVKGKG